MFSAGDHLPDQGGPGAEVQPLLLQHLGAGVRGGELAAGDDGRRFRRSGGAVRHSQEI